MSRSLVVVSLGTIVILAAVVGWQLRHPPAPPLPVLASLGGDFELPSTLGETVALARFRGEIVLLNFGFTSCPDVCPAALARMQGVVASLVREVPAVRPIFVTLDPERDTIEHMKSYLGYFGESFVGMAGTAEQTARVAAVFKVYYEKESSPSAIDYTIAHSSHIYLLDTQGRVRAAFGGSDTVAQMIETVQQLQRAERLQET
jgi:protein SCO1/2